MENRSIINAIGFLSSKERSALYKILSNYSFKILDITKYGNIYKIHTSAGPVCLKKSEYGRKEIKNSFFLSTELIKNGFNNIEKYIPNNRGEIYIRENKRLYYATEWLEGQKCNLSDINDAIICVRTLAGLHRVSSKILAKDIKIDSKIKNILKPFSGYLSDLNKYKKLIHVKRIRNEFDAWYYNYIDYFTNLGMLSLNLLNRFNYLKLIKDCEYNRNIGFNKLTDHNILKTDNGCHIVDLNEFTINLQVYDLAWFLKKHLSKSTINWKFESAKILIDEYSSLNKLTVDHIGVILAILIFPDRFYKLGKKKYIKSKNWSEQKYLDKLHMIIGTIKEKEIFISKYLNYLDELQKSIKFD